MKTRRLKSTRTETGKRKVPSDVSPSTSLPPLVEGHLRCFLCVRISQVLWTVQKPPAATYVRLRWWGESSDGTHFFPKDGSQASQKATKTTAHFPIRCGPKQFTSYLTDMGFLVLEVLTKLDHLPIARAQVVGLSHLSLSQPLSGFYSLLSPTSKKLGELHVSLHLEPLTEAYDNSTSSPNKDLKNKELQVPELTMSAQSRLQLACNEQESAVNSSGNAPRGREQHVQEHKGSSLENQMPKATIPHKHQFAPDPSNQESTGQTTSDLLSVILERGNRLRNALVVSTLKGDMSSPALKDSPMPLPKDNILLDSKSFSSPSETLLLQNILNAGSAFKPSDAATLISDSLDHPADTDNRAVDLLLGSPTPSPLVLWDGEEPFHESSHNSVCVDSELGDPQYDQSLLENLFYKTILDDRESDPEAKDQKLSSRQQQVTQSGPEISRGTKSEPQQSADGLSSEQMNLLSLVRNARVTIASLTVPEDTTTRKSTSKSKPPRPITSKKCTYFIEYVFPVDPSHRDRSKGAGGEVTRAASSKMAGQEVNFHHLSVFPVRFTTATVRRWSETELIFKIYIRKSDQKKPVLIGKAHHLLNFLLQNKQLSETVALPVQNMEGNSEFHEVGPLKVSIELVTDNRDVSSNKSQNKLAAGIIPSLGRETQHGDAGRGDFPAGSRVTSDTPVKALSSQPALHTYPHTSQHQLEEETEILLYSLLMVPDGRNFTCGSTKAPNVYLNCKLFWSDVTAQSITTWGQANPSFHFVQVTPVALTSKLLERLENNMMVIEVWQKTGSSAQDRLLGLVKLPLHQFYMSFRDPKIARLILQAQYPVLGVDCYMPVIDVFSGRCKGNLRVVLAMGKSEQIIALQRTRDEEYDSSPHHVRPLHLLDHQLQSQQTKVIAAQKQTMREHVFVIRVEKVKGLMPLQSTVWGEADCYVQYTFVSQDSDSTAEVDNNHIETSINLKPFRTTTALCVPDPVFGHTETHVLQAPDGVPVQRLLLSSLSAQGLTSGGGVQFEVWCRYYYPNVRDQLVAKSIMPLSKLCALVTMQRQHPSEAEMFSLPLFPRIDCPTEHQSKPSGLLDVCIRYKHRLMERESQTSDGVTLVVQVHRASGLQAAARFVAKQDESLNYFANVGMNTYVSVQLSFLNESERRCTHTVSRTFCPEFDFHMEVPCDLLQHSSSGESRSLAEDLQGASAVFTLWNRDSRTVEENFARKSEDVMLGTVKVPLIDLIHKRTGISGWFGVYLHQEKSSSQHQHVLVGGLDVSLRFAHHSDWEKVINAAHGVGWEMTLSEELGDEKAWTESTRIMTLTISMPRVWLPVHCLLLPGHSELQRSTYCYFRYKFYDNDAFCSQMRHPSFGEVEEEGLVTVIFQESRTIELTCTQPLMWYLREEKLEVQVWAAFTKDQAPRPRDTDRLVGSAFIDLSSIAKTSRQKITVSGVFPLFRRSAADLQGASLRVHITFVTSSVPVKNLAGQMDSDNQEELSLDQSDEADQVPLPSSKSSRTFPDIAAVQHTEMDLDESFPASVVVDQALHLSLKGCPLAERSEGSPCCCVSYVTADSSEPVSTSVIASTDSPVWDHQHQCRLSKQLLIDAQQSLVFKVWHKGEMERVIGFASVDLSSLLWGFQSVCGWYNITDFSGQCHGQLKVSITPLKCVQELRAQRKPVNEENDRKTSAFSVGYHTTATYSSFPSHISQHPEQMITSPDHSRIFFSDRASDSDRHFEHMDNVRLHHQSLQRETAPPSGSSSIADDPSSSFLFSTLRKKLSELDNIQRYFHQKLSPPTFPSWNEQDFSAGKYEKQEETDAGQLLIKSKLLVGEVNNIITGLREQHVEMIPSNPESSSASLSAQDDSPGSLPEVHSPQRDSNFTQEVFPLPSSMANILEDTTDSEPEDKADRKSCEDLESESENKEGSDRTEDEDAHRLDSVDDGDNDDGDEDKDYDEVVVKPRSLNEVTSLTDKTSPWTSVLSDLDMSSLESVEETNKASLRRADGEKLLILNRQTSSCSDQHECDGQDGNRSAGDTSEAESGDERTIQTEETRQGKENKSPREPSQKSLSAHKQDAVFTHGAPSSKDNRPQASDQTEVPNFFLPSHQLEASMRAIQVAPSFRESLSDPDHTSLVHPRRPRHHGMSPSSKKRETERIAKIFAARYNDNNNSS